jgi:hypothetical protein
MSLINQLTVFIINELKTPIDCENINTVPANRYVDNCKWLTNIINELDTLRKIQYFVYSALSVLTYKHNVYVEISPLLKDAIDHGQINKYEPLLTLSDGQVKLALLLIQKYKSIEQENQYVKTKCIKEEFLYYMRPIQLAFLKAAISNINIHLGSLLFQTITNNNIVQIPAQLSPEAEINAVNNYLQNMANWKCDGENSYHHIIRHVCSLISLNQFEPEYHVGYLQLIDILNLLASPLVQQQNTNELITHYAKILTPAQHSVVYL